jgi:ABC-type sugar transport system ATPase subunit
VADTISVLRSGRVVLAAQPREKLTIQSAVQEMLGKVSAGATGLADAQQLEEAVPADGSLVLKDVTVAGALQSVSFEAKPGEVVGLAGLEGAGGQTVLELIFGRRHADQGMISLPSGDSAPRSMNQAVRKGVAYVPADRRKLGLMLEMSVAENISTVCGGPLKRTGILQRRRRQRGRAEHWRKDLGIVMASPWQPVGALSGGNQQKVSFAKWLETDPSVVLLDDPSRGVDMGAKDEMHAVIAKVAASKKVVVYTSSDLDEMTKVCDRILVFFGGAIIAEFGGSVTEHALLEAVNVGRAK